MLLLDADRWSHLLFGEHDGSFVLEIIIRTLVMYLVILVGLRLAGKRGVRQLSVFELVIIIGLGSSAGDPMFYKEVGLLTAIVVFAVLITAYRLTTYLTAKSSRFEKLVEGKTVCLIKAGKFNYNDFNKEDLAQDEFFSELRTKGVSQIGQVEYAYIEISGEISVFFYPDEAVKPGLPILPHEFAVKYSRIPENGTYACSFCSHVEKLDANEERSCPSCNKSGWVKASHRKRIK
jgi:uncharacterized membrane protein YcaP (DUF421 family)